MIFERMCNILKLLPIFLLCSSLSSALPSGAHKSSMISALLELIEQNETRIQELDAEIKNVLMQSHNLNLSPKNGTDQLQQYNSQLAELSLQRREHFLRQNFLDRLKFQIDRNLNGEPPKTFLSRTILQMAQTEATSMGGDIGFSKFCNNLSLAIKEIPEKNENLIAFVEGYIKFSSILDPKTPADFLKHRSYTNGFDSYSADPISKEDVGDLVEKRLKEIHAKDHLERKTFQNRKPILKPLEATLTDASRQSHPDVPYQISAPMEKNIEATVPNMNQPDSPLKLRLNMQQIHNETKEDDSESSQQATESPQKNFE